MGTKRTPIGILYRPSNSWIAGAYYVQNIVIALKYYCRNKDIGTPPIVVFCDTQEQFDEFVDITQYPRLFCHLIDAKLGKLYRFLFRVIKKVTGKKIKLDKLAVKRIKFLYPIIDINIISDNRKKLAWIPDFQEKYYPDLFSYEQLKFRNVWHLNIIENGIPIVFSSNDAQLDFRRFYPEAYSIRTFVLPFAVYHPDFSDENFMDLKREYGIGKKYLFCANQFWVHKNHITLFKAMNILHSKGEDVQLVCTGALHDSRSNVHIKELLNYIKENDLSETIKILGFLERKKQLCIMKNAYAVVQPSLFEGWSTVVEDAKKLNKFVFLSDIKVHREQNPINVCYFNPLDGEELADKILNVTISENNMDYSECVYKSGEAFYKIIKEL